MDVQDTSTKPIPGPFAVEMRARRRNLDLTVAKAARAARISVARWNQLEQGHYKGTPTLPLPDTAVAIAHALDWDVEEAFAAAGLEGVPPEVLQPTLSDQINRLPEQQRESVVRLIQSMLNPHDPVTSQAA